MKVNLNSLATLFVIMALSACSSSSNNSSADEIPIDDNTPIDDIPVIDDSPIIDDGPLTSTADLFGQVYVNYFNNSSAEDSVNFVASFRKLDTALPLTVVQEILQPQLDTCEVIRPGVSPPLDLNTTTAVGGFTAISAGEVITVTGAGGSITELPRVNIAVFIDYESDTISTTDFAPDDLTMGIPGDEFPAFANLSIPFFKAFELITPESGQAIITPSTVFTWVPGNHPDAFVEIQLSNRDIFNIVSVYCNVIDDGSFTIPASAQAEMGTEFSGILGILDSGIKRRVNSFVQQGNALVALQISADI